MIEANRSIVCPDCGATLAGGQASCWLCQRKHDEGSVENPYASPRPTGESLPWQFSLESLILVMTLAAVGLGLFMISPGLGVLFAFIATPALIRTIAASTVRKQKGDRLAVGEKVAVFLLSMLIMALVGLATFVAFGVMCFAGAALAGTANADLETTIGVGLLVGLVAALPLLIWLLQRTRPSNFT